MKAHRMIGRRARAVLAVLALSGTGCASHLAAGITDEVSPAASKPWMPPAEAKITAPPLETKAAALTSGNLVSLAQLVDYALAHNPSTRSSWASARAAAAALGAAKSSWYPQVSVSGSAGYTHRLISPKSPAIGASSVGVEGTLSWLVLDLGGRSGQIDAARQTLWAASYSHDANLQNLILQVEQAYYQYLAAKALVKAQKASLSEAKRNLEAATARQENGLATVADVLQAKTAYSQAMVSLQGAQGQAAGLAGTLSAAVGLRADAPLQVGELPETLKVERLTQKVDGLITRAEKARPDLAAARAQAQAAKAQVSVARSAALPSLMLDANAGATHYFGLGTGTDYGASLVLSFPLFTGFKDSYDIIQAREKQRAAEADAKSLAQRVALQVWQSFQTVQTDASQAMAARDLLDSAQESEKVAAGRYEQGVGNLLDLLTAQSALASARAQLISARANWLVAMASLAHDTGVLGTPPAADSFQPVSPKASEEKP